MCPALGCRALYKGSTSDSRHRLVPPHCGDGVVNGMLKASPQINFSTQLRHESWSSGLDGHR